MKKRVVLLACVASMGVSLVAMEGDRPEHRTIFDASQRNSVSKSLINVSTFAFFYTLYLRDNNQNILLKLETLYSQFDHTQKRSAIQQITSYLESCCTGRQRIEDDGPIAYTIYYELRNGAPGKEQTFELAEYEFNSDTIQRNLTPHSRCLLY